MDFVSHLLAISGFLALVLFYNLWRARSASSTKSDQNSKGGSPPEPSGAWPLIGHLLLLRDGKPVFRTFAALSDRYGPIFSFRLGVHPVVVVSNWEAMKDCFTTNDKALATRPQSGSSMYLSYNLAGFGSAPYGPYWRQMRKLAVLELLSTRRLEMLRHVRVSEIGTTIKELYSLSGKVVVITPWIEQLTLNIVVRMIAGKRYFDSVSGEKDSEARRFRRVIKEFMYVSGDFLLSDVVPFAPLRWIDSMGKLKNVKRIRKELDSIFDSWIEEHVQRRVKSNGPSGDEQEDFIDVMLSVIDDTFNYGHTRETIIKATMLNLIFAGSDTTSTNLTWVLSLLLNNRHALKLAQEEIDTKVGKNRWVEESDIKDLIYLQAIAKETLRLFPPGPISVPHLATEDCQVCGYHIPKGTRLIANVWKLHRDPRIWSNPEKFMPERFLTSHAEVDVSGKHFEFTPFGSGRRSCPGITLAMQVTHLTLARLLQGFDLTTPLNEPVDMTEGFGITLPKTNPVEVLITPRLSSELY